MSADSTWPSTAADWFAARRRPQSAESEERFASWIAADPRHADEYALCELTWELSATAAAGLRSDVSGGRWFRRRVALVPAAAAGLAIVALALYWLLPQGPQTFQTAAGEQRTIALTDGSQITLNTRSSVEVRLGRATRDVRILRGEAFFVVAKDASRPFLVETSLGTARAVGTQFNVLTAAERVEIVTEEGKVWVAPAGDADAGVLTVAGQRATLVPGATRPALDKADLSRIANWRAHRLEFDNVPLEAALEEFSRYTPRAYRVATPEIGRISVSAVLNIGDETALRETLGAAFGLHIVESNGAWLVSGPPPGSAGSDREAPE